jgi:hypothetical protein
MYHVTVLKIYHVTVLKMYHMTVLKSNRKTVKRDKIDKKRKIYFYMTAHFHGFLK